MPRRLLAPGCLGLAGTLLITLAGPRLAGEHWWFAPRLPPGGIGNGLALYGGITLLTAAWLLVGRDLPKPSRLWLLAALWWLPLLAGPALFSHDAYSYLAQGTLAHLGLNPYVVPPAALAGHGQGHVLAAVSPVWRHTTSPYGPLFLALMELVAGVVGGKLIAAVLLIRALEVVGLGVLALGLTRLARALGTDARRATWLALLCPLVGLELVAAAHNDALMIGLVALGIALALERRPLPAIAVAVLAATIKLPAGIAAGLIALAWMGESRNQVVVAGRALKSIGVAVAVLAAVTLVAGYELDWISGGMFSTPARVRLAITPATAVGYTIAHGLGHVGVHLSARSLESALGHVSLAIAATIALLMAWRVWRRPGDLAHATGWTLVAVAALGPAPWPWYFTWGLAVLAATAGPQRSRWLAAVLAVAPLLIKADGVLILPRQVAPVVLAVYVLLGVLAWRLWGRTRGGARPSGSARATAPAARAEVGAPG